MNRKVLKIILVSVFVYLFNIFSLPAQYIILDDEVHLGYPEDEKIVPEEDEPQDEEDEPKDKKERKTDDYIYLEKDKPEPTPKTSLKDLKEFFTHFGASAEGEYIRLSWEYSDELVSMIILQKRQLELYRLDKKPLALEDVPITQRIIRLSAEQTSFRDYPERSGIYYYVIFVKDGTDVLPPRIEEGKNLSNPVAFTSEEDQKKKRQEKLMEKFNKIFTEFKGYQRRNIVVLSWKYLDAFLRARSFKDHRVELYRFDRPIKNREEVSSGNLIAKLFAEKNSYEDVPTQDGNYYYGIFIRRKQLYPQYMQTNRNFIGPLTFQRIKFQRQKPIVKIKPVPKKPIPKKPIPKSTLTLTNLKRIIRNFYYGKQYKKAIGRLSKFQNSANSKIRGKALFYLGLSYFYSDQFRRSIDYFVDPDVIRHDKQRATFWYKRAAGKVK